MKLFDARSALLIFTTLVVALLIYGSGNRASSRSVNRNLPRLVVGQKCTIQFRRDALGAAASLPVSPTTGSINGAETSLSGTFLRIEGDGIVLQVYRTEVWVPRSVILLVQWPDDIPK